MMRARPNSDRDPTCRVYCCGVAISQLQQKGKDVGRDQGGCDDGKVLCPTCVVAQGDHGLVPSS